MRLPKWFVQEHSAVERATHPALARHAEHRAQNVQTRIADGITRFAGSMPFVYLHTFWFVAWVLLEPFGDDFPFGLLTMLVSLEAIYLGTFIMISQNRADERRSELAAEEWKMVQAEEIENQQIMALTRQLLSLTQEVHRLTAEVHAAVAKG